jgi:hypothetical protein
MNNLAVLSLMKITDFRDYHPIANFELFMAMLRCGG